MSHQGVIVIISIMYTKLKITNFWITGNIYCIILAPTRELALQILEVVNILIHSTEYSCMAAIGGRNIKRDLTKIQQNKCDIIVGTPGNKSTFLY